MAVEQISLFIRRLSHNGSSNLDVRWLQETLTECVQKCWLLEVCENKKEAKRREKQKYRLKKEEKRVVVEQISLFIRRLSHIDSSDLVVRWLGEALTECVQKYWLLDACEKKKDRKKRKRGRKKGQKPGQKPGLRQNKTAKD